MASRRGSSRPAALPLAGQVAVVAGATRGGGRGIACMLGAAGATVYCTGRSIRGRPAVKGRPETTDETAEMVTAHGGTGIAVQVDHTVPDQVQRLIDRVSSDHKRLDVLVNNVNGDDLVKWTSFWKQSLDDGLRTLERGINSHVITTRLALPLMLKRKAGLIVGVTDRGGGTFFYGFEKSAVMRMAELLAPELLPHGIGIVALTPGYLRSEAMLENRGVTEANWQDAVKEDPFFAQSETPFYVGRAVAALAADRRALLDSGRLLSSFELAERYGFTDVDGRRPNAARLIASALEEKWRGLVEQVHAEFKRHGLDLDPLVQQHQPTFMLRARVTREDEPERWFDQQILPLELLHSNQKRLATEFYERYASFL